MLCGFDRVADEKHRMRIICSKKMGVLMHRLACRLPCRPAAIRFYSAGSTEATPPTKETEANAPQDTAALLVEKDKQISQLQDLYRRALADAENVRQRTRKELEDKQLFAIQKFAKELLSTVDVLKMALDAVDESHRKDNEHLNNLYVGVGMTQKELLKTLKQFGVESFDPQGERFDPNMHQALFQAAVADKEPGTIFQVTKIGYKIHERILRPAQVGVVKE